MDVIDDTKELYYIDDGTPMDTYGKNPSVLVHDEVVTNLPKEKGEGVSSKASDPIELGSTDVEKLEENLSRSPPPTFDKAERNAEGFAEGENAFGSKGNDTLLFETPGISPPNTLFLAKFLFVETYCFRVFSVAITLVTMGNKDKSLRKEQSDVRSFGLSADPSILEPGMRF
jgi:hypothetical protein